MQKIFALGVITILLLIVGVLLFGISFGVVFQIPNFDRFAPNLLFFIVTACISLLAAILKIAFSKEKNETSVKIPKGASPAVVQAIQALDRNDPTEWKNAIQNLAQMSDPTAREALVNAVEHPTRDVRFQAGFRLAELHDDRGVAAILEAIYGDDWQIGVKAFDAFVSLGGTTVRHKLIEILNHSNLEIRFHAARTLGQIGFNHYNDSVDGLLKSLNDKEAKVRYAAAASLGAIGDKRALPSLLNALQVEKDRTAIEGIIIGLGKLGDGSVVPTLIPLLRSPNNTTAIITNVVTALRRIGTPEALEAVESYRDHWDYWVHDI